MSLMNEYIHRKMSAKDYEKELRALIGRYNKLRNTYLLIYVAAIGKPIPSIALEQPDYFVIQDMLKDIADYKKLDFYIETPGGSGETAEEIVRFTRKHFDSVTFVVSGEAKSAGTIMVLSGDDILMTETGSLGPIDAQVKIGRSTVSAYDYMEWVVNKKDEAEKNKYLNPFDATIVAQITPGELGGVANSLQFAKDLVVEWLTAYKFKTWNTTETRKLPVTDEMKKARAMQIADDLTNRTRWRSHGRSIKIDDLIDEIKLKVTRVDSDKELADVVYRIQTVCRMLFDSTNIFKIIATSERRIIRSAATAGGPIPIPQIQKADHVRVQQKCTQCGMVHNLYGKLSKDPKIDVELRKQGLKPFPTDGKLVCKCGFSMDLSGLKNQIEMDTGVKIVV